MNLIFDVSNIFYRSYFVLSYYNKEFDIVKEQNKLINKVIKDCFSIVRRFEETPQKLIFCFDTSSFRNDLYPIYKENREKRDPIFQETRDKIYDLLKFKKFNVIKIDGLEADDCISLFVYNNFDRNVIITADKDLNQLLDTNIVTYNPQNNINRITKVNWDCEIPKIKDVNIKEVDPMFELIEKVIRGCDGDNILPLFKKIQTKKIINISNDIIDLMYEDPSVDLSNAFQKILSKYKMEVTKEDLDLQLKMVALLPFYFPDECIDEFNKIKFFNQNTYQLDYNNVLNNTIYEFV